MILPDRESWKKWGIEEEVHKFFVQRWYEIFSEETYDSWQLRTSNIKTILFEIIDAIEIVENISTFHRNIGVLIDEAIQVAKKDFVVAEHFPYMDKYLLKLEKCYRSEVRNDSKKELASFRRLVVVILGYIKDYKIKLIGSIRKLLSSDRPEKYKIKLYSLTMSLGVELKSEGYSIQALQESLNILINNTELNFYNRFSKLIDNFSGNTNVYKCSFMVTWPGKLVNLKDYGVVLKKGNPEGIEDSEEIKFYNQDNQAIVATIEVETKDPFSARANAEEIIENLFGFSMLYRPTKKPNVKHQLVLVTSSDGKKQTVEPDTSRLKYIKDSNAAEDNIQNFGKLYKCLDNQSSGQLTASLQHHKLSLNAPTDEARMVNLWIALECLVQHGKGNIIEKVCKYIPPGICLEYAWQIARNLPISFRELWRRSNTDDLRSKLKKSGSFVLHPTDMIQILSDKEDGELLTRFLKFASEQPLLMYRVHHLSKDVFRNQERLSKRIELHQKNIEWQLSRIYRARNLLLHKGVCPSQTRQLLQNLHSYYIATMHNLVCDLRRNQSWSLNDAFEHQLILYDHFQTLLKDKSKDVSTHEILNPFLSLFTAPET